MPLMPQVLVRGQLLVDTLRLKDDANLPAETGRILRCIATHHNGAPAGRDHQRRENPEKRRLPAAIGSDQTKLFRRTHVKRNSIQRSPVLVAVDQVLYGNNGRGGWLNFGSSFRERRYFRDQRKLRGLQPVYDISSNVGTGGKFQISGTAG